MFKIADIFTGRYKLIRFFLTRDIFKKIDGEYWTKWGYDDIHIGYLIKKYN